MLEGSFHALESLALACTSSPPHAHGVCKTVCRDCLIRLPSCPACLASDVPACLASTASVDEQALEA
eukprot:5813717-Pleurochrysis_carterae.AAC.2